MAALLLAAAAAGFWCGILTAGLPDRGLGGGAGTVLLAAGLVAAAGAAFVGNRAGRSGWGIVAPWFLAIASFSLLGAGWAATRQARVESSPVARLAGHMVRVEGALLTDPEDGHLGWTASLAAGRVTPTVFTSGGAYAVHDPLWIEGHGRSPPFEAGDRLSVTGTVELPTGPFGEYLRQRGYPASLLIESVTKTGGPSSPVMRAAGALRATLRSSLRRVFRPKEAGLVAGLALGDTSMLDPQVEEDFRATGLSHLTAVSGENVAMFLAPILALATMLRLGRRARFAVGLGAIGFFVILTRAEPSVLRAAMMSGLAMLGIFLGRPRSPPAIVGGAVLILLAVNPTLVHSIGFQLSVGATVGMAMLASPLSERLRFLPNGLALAAGTTLGAQAGVTPLILYHFGAVPTVTLPANLLAFPAVGPGMLLGLLAAALGVVSRIAGVLVAVLAEAPLRYLEGLADRLGRSPLPSITSGGGGLPGLAAGFAAVTAAAWWLRTDRRLSRRGKVVVAGLLPILLWWHGLGAGPPGTLTVTFFDVGQGDAAVVRSAGGAVVLIDGGPDTEQVAGKLAALGVRRIDLMVATHPHADHVAGLPTVLARFPVGLVVDPGCRGSSPYYADLLRAVRASGVPFGHPRPGSILHVGDLLLQVLGPYHCASGTESDPNNDSVILRVEAGSASILFPGDAEVPEQTEVVQRESSLLVAAVLKVPHHGGATSLAAFLADVHARVAVVSVGPNRYGHPVASVLATLARDGMRVFRTDRSGDVTVRFASGGLVVEQSRPHG